MLGPNEIGGTRNTKSCPSLVSPGGKGECSTMTKESKGTTSAVRKPIEMRRPRHQVGFLKGVGVEKRNGSLRTMRFDVERTARAWDETTNGWSVMKS